jgi:hypothetical protein
MDAFLLYVDDWLSSKKIAMMDAVEERGYLRLLLYAAKEPDCGLPDDDNQLAVISLLGHQWNRVTKELLKRTHDPETRVFRTSGAKLRECFLARDGRLYNTRLMQEFIHQKEVREARARAGKIGVSARQRAKAAAFALANGQPYGKPNGQPSGLAKGVTNQEQTGKQNATNPNPKPKPEVESQNHCAPPSGDARVPADQPAETPTMEESYPDSLFPLPKRIESKESPLEKQQMAWFTEWWAEYWTKRDRKKAWQAFKKHVRTQERFEVVMRATRAQKPEMMARLPENRPYGSTWLNGERWEDEEQPRMLPPRGNSLPDRRLSATDEALEIAREIDRRNQCQ